MKTEIRCLLLMDTGHLLHMTESARLSHRKTRTATLCLLLMDTDRRIRPASRKTLQKYNGKKNWFLIWSQFFDPYPCSLRWFNFVLFLLVCDEVGFPFVLRNLKRLSAVVKAESQNNGKERYSRYLLVGKFRGLLAINFRHCELDTGFGKSSLKSFAGGRSMFRGDPDLRRAVGMVIDLMVEKGNDGAEENSGNGSVRAASQADFDAF